MLTSVQVDLSLLDSKLKLVLESEIDLSYECTSGLVLRCQAKANVVLEPEIDLYPRS